ncbi:MAG: Mrp/NBP35 family ATP-binding protein [Bacillota bacterium]|nr:Mrp/NBP35 family ATP-binding protein [Bacillota bacterium]
MAPAHPGSNVKKVIGVVSGKGGVGKSLVTSMLAVAMARKGRKTAILDGDLTGPSIPKVFGIKSKAVGTDEGLLPTETENGLKLMSINLLLEHDTDPVVWRGPVIAGTVKQFWSEVIWGDVDYMFVDMPPGTGDVPLTVFQSLPLDGVIIVTSPQDLVSMIVGKAVKMAYMMSVPVLGLVENMSYFRCPDCGKEHAVFGESHLADVAKEYGLVTTARLPIDPAIAATCDAGRIEELDQSYLDALEPILAVL